MKNRYLLLMAFCSMGLFFSYSAESITWKQSLHQPETWYSSDEAVRIADNILLYQRDIGGWAKNIDMAIHLDESDTKNLLALKNDKKDVTIDNGATHTQLTFLAKMYQGTHFPRYLEAFNRGLDFLLAIQYDNGGWPQFPYQGGYKKRITYNDGAMIGVMTLLKHVADGDERYAFVDNKTKRRIARAMDRGIDCILKTQIVVDGKLTGWCAQHDEETLAPAPARTYEKISLSGSEGVGVVRFLMTLEKPSPKIIRAIESAAEWFNHVKITGIKEIRKEAPSTPKGFDKIIVEDEQAPPIWARFYQIKTNRPIFCGRDGIIKYTISEIEYERRNGYSWYTSASRNFLDVDYPAWKKRIE